MKNTQTWLVRAMLGHLSDLADNCTRYNSDAVCDSLGTIDITYRNTKLVVSNYADYKNAFTLKIMRVTPVDFDDASSNDVLDMMVLDAIDHIAKGDATFRTVDSASAGLKHTGLNSSYVHPIRGIANCIADASSGIGKPVVKIHYIASAPFGNACVGMVFQCAGSVYILQFRD